MTDLTKKMKHLDFIQLTITRMAANSFLLKAWGVTVVAGIFAFAATETRTPLLYVAFVPVLAFWILDGYYLQQEKRFRSLYDDVRLRAEDEIDFDLRPPVTTDSWLRSMFSKTELIFYGVIAIAIALSIFIVR